MSLENISHNEISTEPLLYAMSYLGCEDKRVD